MKNDDGIEALVLAGTELPLLLRDSPPAGMELLDTTIISRRSRRRKIGELIVAASRVV